MFLLSMGTLICLGCGAWKCCSNSTVHFLLVFPASDIVIFVNQGKIVSIRHIYFWRNFDNNVYDLFLPSGMQIDSLHLWQMYAAKTVWHHRIEDVLTVTTLRQLDAFSAILLLLAFVAENLHAVIIKSDWKVPILFTGTFEDLIWH